jgi:membrane protease YdiL (CAAX protease family)
MNQPTLLGGLFLLYLLVVLPVLALRTVRWFRGGGGAPLLPGRTRLYGGALLMQGMLFLVAWVTGREADYHFFALPVFGLWAILAGVAALAMQFALRGLSQAMRSEEERRDMPVLRLVPRAPGEWRLYLLLVVATAIAEEAAYRGVGMAVLWWTVGNPWIAAAICAAAFAVAHAAQGWKTMAVAFPMALVMHGLVEFTGALVLAMVVHLVYDVATGAMLRRQVLAGHVSKG